MAGRRGTDLQGAAVLLGPHAHVVQPAPPGDLPEADPVTISRTSAAALTDS